MDIVDRLRQTEEETATVGQKLVYLQVPVNPDGPEGANEIERLRNKVEWLEMCEKTVVKQDNEIEWLRQALRMWVRFWEADSSIDIGGDALLAEEAMEVTRELLGEE